MNNSRKFAVLAVTLSLVIVSIAYVFANEWQPTSHGVGVLKSADRFAAIGDVITYQIRVFNPSDYDLYNINVTDAMLNLSDTIPFMSANNMSGVTHTVQKEILETDPNPLVNTVFVEAIDSEGAYSSASTQAITNIVEQLIDIEKVGPDVACTDTNIQYTITVNNTAEVDLIGVLVEDEMLGFSWEGDLDAGESNVFNLTFTVPCDAAATLTNTATVHATHNQTTIYAEDSWTTEITHPFYPRSKGYWKNYPDDWPTEEIGIGGINYTKNEAVSILIGANAKDATRMLAAQLLAAKLNRLSQVAPCDHYNETMDIDNVIEGADAFLENYPLGSDPRDEIRQEALQIKDVLDAYNNSSCN